LSLAMLTALMVVNGETLAPWGEERAQSLKSVRNKDLVVAQYSGLWAREGDMFLNARNGERSSVATTAGWNCAACACSSSTPMAA
jgi:lipopolysaccharide export system permease protein